MKEQLKLSELNTLLKRTITDFFTAPVWVIAEISELKANRNGHCYLVLIEKDPVNDTIVAQARATIWSYTFKMLRPFFESTTGRELSDGLKVLVNVSVEFHELYGYSLNIRDIDPTYTLGDLARRRLEIIARLNADGVFEMNKQLEMPFVPQKIAIISSPTAAGYQDFVDQLINNQYSYKFYTKLFPAIMQGNQAETSIISALENVFDDEDFFDVVVIIRGGGSQADLSCFDNYNMAYFITQFPLPILTGIGHEKDDSIVDMVAHRKLKTPTAVAEFLITSVREFESKIEDYKIEFEKSVIQIVSISKNRIEQVIRLLSPLVIDKIKKKKGEMNHNIWKLDKAIKKCLNLHRNGLVKKEDIMRTGFLEYVSQRFRYLDKKGRQMTNIVYHRVKSRKEHLHHKIIMADKLVRKILSDDKYYLNLALQKAQLTDPHKILSRGYSITTFRGKALKSSENLVEDDIIETKLYNGSLTSKVKISKM